MSTFLRGGLWCAELNTIPSFDGDVEGSQPFGLFVSCWHLSAGDPTPKAWEIFGDSGNGFALRAKHSFMTSLAERFNTRLRLRFDQVRYLSVGEKPTDPAFQVGPAHDQEQEMRLAVLFPDIVDPEDHQRKEQIAKRIQVICSKPRAAKKFEEIAFVDNEGDEAIVLPVSPAELIEEIVIGPRVQHGARKQFTKMLQEFGMESRIRK